jgi:hypothetical protein
MPQTKADRSAAAKKAAATRQRNAQRTESHVAGKRAASTRQGQQAHRAAQQAQSSVSSVVTGAKSAVKFAGRAAVETGKAIATRAGARSR